jgi:hypothetical protein
MRALIAALFLAACATPAQRAASLSSPALCYVAYAGNANDRQVVRAELAARGFTCSRDDVVMGQRDFQAWRDREAQRRAAAAEIGSRLLYVKPPEQRPMINCHTDNFGNTTCW